MDIGVERSVRETFFSSLELAKDVLQGLGVPAGEVETAVQKFREYDEALIRRQDRFHQDEEQLIASTREAAEELERVFEQDTQVIDANSAGGTAST